MIYFIIIPNIARNVLSWRSVCDAALNGPYSTLLASFWSKLDCFRMLFILSWPIVSAVSVSLKINNMLKYSNLVETGTNNTKLDWLRAALYSEYNETTFEAISEILMLV